MTQRNLVREHPLLYAPHESEVAVVDVPSMNFLMIDGTGDPNTSHQYQQALQTLYPLAHMLQFMSKQGANIDYAVMPLEILWWRKDKDENDVALLQPLFFWRALIMQPDHITPALYELAIKAARNTGELPALKKIRFETFHEGLCAQIMHNKASREEETTIEQLHQFIHEHGYEFNGKHHQIYLDDSDDNTRTIIRQPIRK